MSSFLYVNIRELSPGSAVLLNRKGFSVIQLTILVHL